MNPQYIFTAINHSYIFMKELLIFLLAINVCLLADAQSFSVNTDGSTADNSAILDVKSADKGMLIPRMTKAQKNAIGSPATGLLVFQQSPDSVGFYYYSGTSWLWLPGNNVLDTLSWKRNGNAATNPAIHFIGTLDNQPVSFRQNNTWLGRWDKTTNNYFIGDSAGSKITNGRFNTGMGDSAGYNNTSGNSNIFIGDKSGYTNTSGSSNLIIGSLADVLLNSLVNATAIGYRAAVDTSNALILGSINGINGATSYTNVGIGTTKPLAMLHVKDKAVLFSALNSLPFPASDPPVSGAGNRMMWYADKAAFRAGGVVTDEWNNFNVGYYSTALGIRNKASGWASTAAGTDNTVSNNYTTAFGNLNNVSGESGSAIGTMNNITGSFSHAIGVQNTVDGINAAALGSANISSGAVSIALGNFTRAIADRSTTMGYNTRAKSFASVVMGQWNDTSSTSTSTWVTTDPLFVLGNGTAHTARSNALTVLKNGNVGIGATVNPQYPLHVVNDNGQDGGWAQGIVIENISALANVGEAAVSFRNAAMPSSSQWSVGLNQSSIFAVSYGASFASSGTRLAIDTLGNVGVGTTTPVALIDVDGTYKMGTNGTVNSALIKDTVNINVGSIPANGELDITVALANVTTNGTVSVSPAADINSGIIIAWARVSAAGTIKIRYRNLTGAAIDPPAINYYVSVVQ